MSGTIDLAADELALVRDILRAHLPAGTRAWVFGSRATGSARRYSDLDLALESDARLDGIVLGELREALSESVLRYKVDVLDLRAVEPAFRALIEPEMIPLAF